MLFHEHPGSYYRVPQTLQITISKIGFRNTFKNCDKWHTDSYLAVPLWDEPNLHSVYSLLAGRRIAITVNGGAFISRQHAVSSRNKQILKPHGNVAVNVIQWKAFLDHRVPALKHFSIAGSAHIDLPR